MACDAGVTVAQDPKSKIPDAVKTFDSSKYKKPMFKGTELYTGPHRTPKGMHGLMIAGYNYTDGAIYSFAVGAAGGGGMEVSRPGGYGGGTCCAPILDDIELPITVDISWNRDGDVWCKQTVLLDGPVPTKPNVFEVHFYQDGTIQVTITEEPSLPRLNLDRFNRIQRKASGNVNNDSKFSECKSGR